MSKLLELAPLTGELPAAALQALFEERKHFEAPVGDTFAQLEDKAIRQAAIPGYRPAGNAGARLEDLQLVARVPASSIDQQHDLFLRACPAEASELHEYRIHPLPWTFPGASHHSLLTVEGCTESL